MGNNLSKQILKSTTKQKGFSKLNGKVQLRYKLLSTWQHVKPFIGYPLIYAGVMLMAVLYFTNLTNYNYLVFIPMILITIGIMGRVKSMKDK